MPPYTANQAVYTGFTALGLRLKACSKGLLGWPGVAGGSDLKHLWAPLGNRIDSQLQALTLADTGLKSAGLMQSNLRRMDAEAL